MNPAVAATLFALQMISAPESEEAPGPDAAREPATQERAFKDAMVRAAVREALKEKAEPIDPAEIKSGTYGVAGASRDKYAIFAEKVAQARLPDCLHGDGLKFQPPVIGPIGLTGYFAMPFVALAIARGKCRL